MQRAGRRVLLFGLLMLLALAVIVVADPRPAEAQETGDGLKGRYYNNKDFTSPELSRTDSRIDFPWGKGSPARGISHDTFSVRWTGYIEVPTSGAYTFHTRTNDGTRLWIAGEPVVEAWQGEGVRERSGGISLEAGRRYQIKAEYRDLTGSASAKLMWSGPGIEKQVVPAENLFLSTPPPTPQCADGQDNDGDGQADHPADPGCDSHTDDSESPDPLPEDAERWSDPATWGGTVPQAGAEVTIPAGKTIVLDRDVDLSNLTVQGTLVFDERDIELSTDWIMVHGTLRIGTESEPFQHRAEITLSDETPSENVMNMGDKVLGVMGGTLEVHGEQRLSWTKLGAHAAKGSNKITLSQTPDWRPGDRIVISSTDYDQSQDEEATVTAISGNTVTLDRQLQYAHWGTIQTFDGRPVDERAEVALLSRNVTIQGEPVSSANGFGGQIMVMDMTMDGMTHRSAARLEGVELERMGQKNILRRYPLHFHMLGDGGANSYLKDSSVHHTFNRCVTIHGTNQLQIHDNVCFDHIGHGYFFEDGAETDNVLTDNLGLKTRRPANGERLLPSDGNPATFWITNPDNIVRGNVAAGSDSNGFWLAFPQHPTGLSTNPNVWPRRTPLGEFSGNTAHSNGGDGLHVDGGPRPDGSTETTYYHPRQNPSDTSSAEVVAEFQGYTAYKNRGEAVWLRGENHRLADATLADNAIGATFASHESYLDDSLVVGETANKGTPEKWQVDQGKVGLDGRSLPRFWEPDFPIRGYQFYDGRVGARNTTFVNFTPNTQRKASGLGVLLEDAFSLHPDNFASNLRFVNASRFYMRGPEPGKDGDNSAVFVDETGSVTGTIGAVVTANNPFLATGECSLNNDWNAYICPPGTDHVGLISYVNEGEAGRDLSSYIKPLTLTREPDGPAQSLMGCCDDSTHATSNLLANRAYDAAFNGGTPKMAEFVLYHGAGRWLRLSMAYPVTPKVTKYGCDVAGTGWCGGGKATSLADLDTRVKSSYYYDASNQRLYLKLVAGGADWEALEVQPSPLRDGAAPPTPVGSGAGLKAEYFDNRDLTGLKTTRTDAAVDFSWNGIPSGTALTSGDTFSVRWTGQIEAPETADYNFVTTTDDGVRLWVCGQLLVDDWNDHAATDARSSVAVHLEAGQRCEVRMEHYDNTGGAVARLRWDYAGYRTHVVPRQQFHPAP